MARCAHSRCRKWRPGLLVRLAGLGLFLDEAWYCSAHCLGVAVRRRVERAEPIVPTPRPQFGQLRLGGLLALQKRLAPGLVEQAASAQSRTGLRIGTQLVELGVVTPLDVLRALAAQSGVGFLATLDPARLTHAPGGLSTAVVRALGVVPFEADRRHDVLKVACTAPVPRGSLAALRGLTGSIIEPYLVADEHWPALLRAYGAGRRSVAGTPTLVTDVAALASRVADAARQSRSLRMSEAWCDDKLWVRLDAGGEVEELLMTAGPDDRRAAESGAVATAASRPKRPRAARSTTPRARRQSRTEPAAPAPSLAVAPAAFREGRPAQQVPAFEQ